MYNYNNSKYNVVICPCDVDVSFRWASWMLTSVGPASLACLALCTLTCISVTQGGYLSTQMPRRHSRSCLSASCWKIRMMQSCGGVLRRQVGSSANGSIPKSYHILLLIAFSTRFSFSAHPTALIGQFVSDVAWGELDVLLVDTPPGTSDEHLAVLENMKKHSHIDGAVLVTTPQVTRGLGQKPQLSSAETGRLNPNKHLHLCVDCRLWQQET